MFKPSDLRARTVGILSLSHILQKSSHAADWFPISTAECIGLMLNPETKTNKAGAIGLASKKYDQIRSAANMKSQSAATSDHIGCKESYSQ